MMIRVIVVLASALVFGTASSQTVTPGFNTLIPESIVTPDSVETSIGTLNFFDGLPDEETVTKVYDNLDRIRATQAFLDMVPLASIEGLRRGMTWRLPAGRADAGGLRRLPWADRCGFFRACPDRVPVDTRGTRPAKCRRWALWAGASRTGGWGNCWICHHR